MYVLSGKPSSSISLHTVLIRYILKEQSTPPWTSRGPASREASGQHPDRFNEVTTPLIKHSLLPAFLCNKSSGAGALSQARPYLKSSPPQIEGLKQSPVQTPGDVPAEPSEAERWTADETAVESADITLIM